MRQLLVRGSLIVVALAVAGMALNGVPPLTDDFIAYWSSAQVLAHGGNPYDPAELLAIQRSAGWRPESPLPVWYGPWAVALTLPLGWVPYWSARLGWLGLQAVLLIGATAMLWREYGGATGARLPWLLLATFAPGVLCLLEGQITPLLLLGLAGFLTCVRRERYWLAGVALFPLATKPAVVYLLWLSLAVWTLRARRVAVVGGLVLSCAAMLGLALLFNSRIIEQWLALSSTVSPLVQDFTPTIGSVLRVLFGADRRWLAYVPAIVGVGWWLVAWGHHRGSLDWTRRMPLLILVSLSTAPFAWFHDGILLLPAVLQVEANRGELPALHRRVWLLVNGLAIASYPLLRYRQTWYLLFLAAMWLGYFSRSRAGTTPSGAS